MGRKRKQLKQDCVPTTSKKLFAEVMNEVGIIKRNSSTSGSSMELHPLYNSVILTNLFKFCSWELQVTCRLVCKTWRDVSISALGSRTILNPPFFYCKKDEKIYLCDHNYNLASRPASHPHPSLCQFLQFWGNKTAHQNLRLTRWKFGFEEPKSSKKKRGKQSDGTRTKFQIEIEQFLELFGKSVKKLELIHCTFANNEQFGKVVYQSFPDLQTLSLASPILTDGEKVANKHFGEHRHLKKLQLNDWPNFPVDYAELLSHFPLLTSIDRRYSSIIYGPGHDHDGRPTQALIQSDVQCLLEAINVIREEDGSKLPLTNLDIINPLLEVSNETGNGGNVESYELFRLFRKLNLPLSISFKLDCNLNVVRDVTTLHKNTLSKIEALKGDDKELDIFGSGFGSEFPFDMKLNNLKEMTISDRFCQSMDFLKYTPNLETLRVFTAKLIYKELLPLPETSMIANTGKTGMGNVKLLKLKTFSFRYKITNDDLRYLVIWFPNLERLSMLLDNAQFELVCGNWEKLVHLHVLGGRLTDKAVTGTNLKRAREGKRALRPNISSLKHLECFRIQYKQARLTDSSVFHGFLKTPTLKILDITSYREFGEEAKRMLLDSMNLQIEELQDRDDSDGGGLRSSARTPKKFWRSSYARACEFGD